MLTPRFPEAWRKGYEWECLASHCLKDWICPVTWGEVLSDGWGRGEANDLNTFCCLWIVFWLNYITLLGDGGFYNEGQSTFGKENHSSHSREEFPRGSCILLKGCVLLVRDRDKVFPLYTQMERYQHLPAHAGEKKECWLGIGRAKEILSHAQDTRLINMLF